MKISVLIVSYRRPQLLANCLRALARQTRLPDEVLVVGVEGDGETETVARACEGIQWLASPAGDVVRQLNLGLAQATGDIICLIDDDAEAFPDWLERIEPHYANPRIGAVGGPDYLHDEQGCRITGRATHVGRITWFGRLWGNHHLSYPDVVAVDVLKGCNMSFRRALAPAVDERMSVGGRCHHWELDIALRIRQQGKLLVYNPAVRVNHYPGPRTAVLEPGWVYMANFNLVLVFLKYFHPLRQLAFLLYTFLWGDLPEFGLGVFVLTCMKQRQADKPANLIPLLAVSLRAKVDALRALARGEAAAGS